MSGFLQKLKRFILSVNVKVMSPTKNLTEKCHFFKVTRRGLTRMHFSYCLPPFKDRGVLFHQNFMQISKKQNQQILRKHVSQTSWIGPARKNCNGFVPKSIQEYT